MQSVMRSIMSFVFVKAHDDLPTILSLAFFFSVQNRLFVLRKMKV